MAVKPDLHNKLKATATAVTFSYSCVKSNKQISATTQVQLYKLFFHENHTSQYYRVFQRKTAQSLTHHNFAPVSQSRTIFTIYMFRN